MTIMTGRMRSTQWLSTTVAAAMLAIGCAGTPAFAQRWRPSTFPPPPPAHEVPAPETDGPLLAGPEVEDAAAAANDPMGGLGGPGAEARPRRVRSVPFPQWVNVLRELELTAEQQELLRSLGQEMQQAERRFRIEHGDEMRALEAARRDMPQGQPPDPELRAKFAAIESERPKQEDYQRRMWAALTAEQQETMRAKLDAMEKRMMTDRRRGVGPDGRPTVAAGRPAADGAGATAGGAGGPDGMAPDAMAPDPMNPEKERPTTETERAMRGPEQGAGEMAGDGEAGAAPRRARARWANDPRFQGLDDAGRRRLAFLIQHQSRDLPGREPSEAERRFRFDDE